MVQSEGASCWHGMAWHGMAWWSLHLCSWHGGGIMWPSLNTAYYTAMHTIISGLMHSYMLQLCIGISAHLSGQDPDEYLVRAAASMPIVQLGFKKCCWLSLSGFFLFSAHYKCQPPSHLLNTFGERKLERRSGTRPKTTTTTCCSSGEPYI
jgi:hypothetical protein